MLACYFDLGRLRNSPALVIIDPVQLALPDLYGVAIHSLAIGIVKAVVLHRSFAVREDEAGSKVVKTEHGTIARRVESSRAWDERCLIAVLRVVVWEYAACGET